MKHISNTIRWSAVAVLALVALSGLTAACNSHPVEFAQTSGGVSVHEDRSPGSAAAVDILWVIDNSGSMCEEQSALRENFREFITQITDRNIDFHIGVTTTQMDPYNQEPVALPGHLQSTPQPVPSSIPTCHGDEGDESDSTDGYQPIREAIDLAIQCSKDPDEWEELRNVTDEEISCQILPDSECDCNDEERGCARRNLFPTYEDNVSPYRSIDKVLRFSEYQQDNGTFDEAGLEADFACMSMVGTSGYFVEKGLSAAVEAVSPEMTGGTVESPTDEDAPNHGFLRDAANFSVIFVTDETDCSHDGGLRPGTACGDDVCAFAGHPDWDDSPLIPSEDLADMVRENLKESKGYTVEDDSIIAASIHGRWKGYGQEPDYPAGQLMKMEDCEASSQAPSDSIAEQTSCDTAFGTAYSGDRYESFLREFDHVFPEIPNDPNEHMQGLICQPDQIAHTLEQIGETIAGTVSSCIYQVPHSCTSSDQCPDYTYGEGTAECLPFAESGESYCNSGIQLRMAPSDIGEKTFEDLENHEYCVPGSIDSPQVPGGCVIKPEMYEFEPCAGAETEAVNLNWTDPRYFNTLSGYEVELVYTLLTEERGEAANNSADLGN